MASAEAAVRAGLPATWSLQIRSPRGAPDLDGFADLVGPGQQKITFAIEARRSGAVSATSLVDQLIAIAARASEPLLFLTDYANPTLRGLLNEAGINYADGTGWMRIVRDEPLLDRWTQDYTFLNSNSLVLDNLAPRGLAPVLEALRTRRDVCVTGSAAARTYLPGETNSVVPLTQLACFAADIQALAADLQLTRADRYTSNVLLTRPADPSFLASPRRSADGLPTAPVSQALADLVTLPGRAGQEAEQLIDVLAATDPAWRM